ncbi:MAG: hybrid sensor histidine kinase/response regulator transcription factor [Mongoliitalea sp.]
MKVKCVIGLFFIGVSFGFFSDLQGQQLTYDNIKFDRIGVQKGLSQNSVLSIYQDIFGFIWLGTRDGLNKFDGYDFEIFRHEINNKTSLGGNTVTEIQGDSKGNIWVITENGLSFLDRKKGTFKNYTLPSDQYESTLFNALLIDKLDRIWVGGRFGLFLFDVEKEEFSKVGSSSLQLLGMVTALTVDFNGKILVGSSRMTIHSVEQDLSLKRIELELPSPSTARVEAMVVKGDSLWIGSYGDGLYLFNSEGKFISQFKQEVEDINKRLTNNNIRTLEIDNEGSLWVGTFDGLNLITDQNKVISIFSKPAQAESLSHGSIRSILKDKNGSIWIGTYQGGLNLYDPNLQRFEHYYSKPGEDTSLSYDVVGAFAVDSKGKVFIGTERGGLNRVEFPEENHTSIKRNSTIKSLMVDFQDQVWMGVFREGLQKLQTDGRTILNYPSSSQPDFAFLKRAIINFILPDGKKGLWLAVDSGGGLFYFDIKTEKFSNYLGQDELQEYLRNYPVKSLTWLENDKLMLATKGKGVVFFDTKLGTFETFDSFGDDSIFADEINHLFLDKKGRIWISSQGEGIILFDLKNRTSQQFHTGNGLLNNVVLGTLQDNEGNLWFVCINGINKLTIDGDNYFFKSYRLSSGFPLIELNEGAFLKLPTGEFLIGGINGYVKFDPLKIKDNEHVPNVLLTNLSVSNKRVSPNDESGILDNNIYKTEKIILTYFQSIFSIDFAALNYIRPENNSYAYQLVGFDEDWVQTNGRRSATYTSLPDGTYTFLVKGSNNDGIWNEIPAKLEIVILPPPWKTWWAISIYGIVIVFGFWIIRRNAIKSTQLKNTLLLEQLEKEKWREFHDLKLKYFIDVSHEFRTPLTLILSPLEDIIARGTGDSWLKSRLRIMFFNAKRLLHLIDQILEIREIETGHSQQNLKPLFLESFLADILDSFKGLADKQKIKLSAAFDGLPQQPLWIDQDKMEKILFNLLSNAFKFTQVGGEITFTVQERGGVYHFTIKDNGRGISQEALPHIFDRFFKESKKQYGAGIGLSLTNSLVSILGGKISVESQLGKGTAFFIEMPFEIADEIVEKESSNQPFVKPVPLEYQDTELAGMPEDSSDSKPTLLIVEDNVELKKFLKGQFSHEYEVITAKNGVSGLNKALKSDPALIISDVMMPEMDGMELCKAIKTNPAISHIPIILLTAKSAQNFKLEGLEYGADDFISKPFNILELKAKVKSILKNRALVQEKFRGEQALGDSKGTLSTQDRDLMQKVQQLVDEHLSQPNLTVDFLSDQIGMSRVHLFRKIKALTGLTPSEFIKEKRMNLAMKLLLSQKHRVSDIAYEVGFQDVAYFGKVFKKHFGHSPGEVKKQE